MTFETVKIWTVKYDNIKQKNVWKSFHFAWFCASSPSSSLHCSSSTLHSNLASTIASVQWALTYRLQQCNCTLCPQSEQLPNNCICAAFKLKWLQYSRARQSLLIKFVCISQMNECECNPLKRNFCTQLELSLNTAIKCKTILLKTNVT